MSALPDRQPAPLRMSALFSSKAPGIATLRAATVVALCLLLALPLLAGSAPRWLLPLAIGLVMIVAFALAAAVLHRALDAPVMQHERATEAPPLDRTADIRELFGHHEAIQEEERRAIARAIHDDLGSGLTALNMHLAILFQQMPAEPKLVDRAAQAKGMLGAVAEATRRIHRGLRPEKLDVFGFKAAIAEQAVEFEKASGITCNVSLPDEALEYTPQVDIALLRMVQEALDNVARHADASRVNLVLDDTDEEIVLSVRDDGRGMTRVQQESFATHGLRVMRERAAYLGGRVEIDGESGRGTTVVITLPKASHAMPDSLAVQAA